MVSILTDVLAPKYRKALYVVYAFAGLVLGAIQVASQPEWLADALAVYAFVGTALGLTAGANVPNSKGAHEA